MGRAFTAPFRLVWTGVGVALLLLSSSADADTSNDEARAQCRRQIGGTAEFERIDKTRGVIYCRSGGRLETVPLKKSKASAKAPVSEEVEPPITTRDVSESSCKSSSDDGCVVVDDIRNTNVPDYRSKYLEQARTLCERSLGQGAVVDHFDYYKWQVYCKKP